MLIQVASDIHLEFAEFSMQNYGADVLVLSGDIMCAKYVDGKDPDSISKNYQRAVKFFGEVSARFKHVVYVAGNHEFYGHKWFKAPKVLEEFCSAYPNVYFLENDCVQIDDVVFVGCTLWTDLNKGDPRTLHEIRDIMNDYRAITNDATYSKLKPINTAVRHKQSLEYISHAVSSDSEVKYVVVGHHAPSYASVHHMYLHEFISNGAYVSDLEDFIKARPQIKLWTHGHMHDPSSYKIGSTRVICNPRGYLGYETRANTWTGGEFITEV